MTDVQASLKEYRDVREELERAVLPLATSVDGRRFNFQTTLYGLELEPGGYVARERRVDTARAGARWSSRPRTPPALACPRCASAAGATESCSMVAERPFHDATVRPATPDEVDEWLGRVRPARRGARGRGAGARERRAGATGRERVRAPHIPVRPVGLRQDVLARCAPGAALDGDQPARGGARSELGLRAAGGHARGRRCSRSRALRSPGRLDRGAQRRATVPRSEFASASSARRCRRRCCGSTRSRTARSTRS